MSEHIDHKCGVGAAAHLKNEVDVVPATRKVIFALKHRGNLGAGLSWVKDLADNDGDIGVLKGTGDMETVLTDRAISEQCAVSSIASAQGRYATNCHQGDEFCQPYEFSDGTHQFSLVFNGNTVMHKKLQEFIKQNNIPLRREGDTEIIGQLILWEMQQSTKRSMKEVLHSALSRLEGSFNIILMMRNRLIALRDKFARHPLKFALEGELDDEDVEEGDFNGEFIAFASEDIALRELWPHARCYDIPPGHMVDVNIKKQRIRMLKLWDSKQLSCFLEWLYFADHRSSFDGNSVSNARFEAGKILAEMDEEWVAKELELPIEERTIVVPVPNSAKTAARGYADKSGLQNVEAILRNKKIVGDKRS